MIERRDKLDVFMSSQYTYEETGGVQRWVIEAKPWIELKTGGKVVPTFPKKKTDNESTLPEGCHFLGKAFSLPFQHHDNRYQASGWVDPKEVRKVLLLEKILPDIGHILEPFPLVYPTGTPGIINGLPRISGVIINPHVAIEHLKKEKLNFFIEVVKLFGYHKKIMQQADRTLAVSQATVATWSRFLAC